MDYAFVFGELLKHLGFLEDPGCLSRGLNIVRHHDFDGVLLARDDVLTKENLAEPALPELLDLPEQLQVEQVVKSVLLPGNIYYGFSVVVRVQELKVLFSHSDSILIIDAVSSFTPS